MPAISAVDAISPAVQRTRGFLFRPFRWGTYLKLCLVAMITEGLGGNFGSAHGGPWSSHRHMVSSAPLPHLSHGWIAGIVAGSVILIALCFFLAYLITRLRFAYFHCLIHDVREIRPGWRLYRGQARRFFWMNVVVGLCFLAVLALVALPFIGGFWRLMHSSGGHPDFGSVLFLVLPLIPLFFLIVLLGIVTDLILRDLMLPHYALENATAGQAWAAVRGRIGAEKAGFFVYGLLRVAIPIVATIALGLAIVILALILAGVGAISWFSLHAAAASAGGVAAIAGRLLLVLLLLASFGALIILSISLFGSLGTAIREYALVFYAGRYQRLGEILFPPPPAAVGEPGMA